MKHRTMCGPAGFRLNIAKARRAGFRIFEARLCCGCCKIKMAFYTLHNARVQFSDPEQFAGLVRDDMGNLWECVNIGSGFREIKRSPATKQKGLDKERNLHA